MTISNQASGIRPGVCTSTTRPATPYTGMIIYETDTGYLLVWDGAAWDYLSRKQDTAEGLPSETYMGLVKVIPTGVTGGTLNTTTGTITIGSAVSSVVVNGAFTSLYDNYRIIFSASTPSTNNDLYLRLALAGTASVTGYYRGFSYVSLSTGAVTGVGNANTDNHIISSVTNNAFRHTGIVDVLQPALAQYTGIVSTSYIMRTDIASSGVTGSHQVSTAYDGFVILTSSGTITGGTIRVYGYKN